MPALRPVFVGPRSRCARGAFYWPLCVSRVAVEAEGRSAGSLAMARCRPGEWSIGGPMQPELGSQVVLFPEEVIDRCLTCRGKTSRVVLRSRLGMPSRYEQRRGKCGPDTLNRNVAGDMALAVRPAWHSRPYRLRPRDDAGGPGP